MQPPMMPHIAASDRPEFVRAPVLGPPGEPDVVSPVGVVGGGVAKTGEIAVIINNNHSLMQNSSWQQENTTRCYMYPQTFEDTCTCTGAVFKVTVYL